MASENVYILNNNMWCFVNMIERSLIYNIKYRAFNDSCRKFHITNANLRAKYNRKGTFILYLDVCFIKNNGIF